jgi:hypothetical protein
VAQPKLAEEKESQPKEKETASPPSNPTQSQPAVPNGPAPTAGAQQDANGGNGAAASGQQAPKPPGDVDKEGQKGKTSDPIREGEPESAGRARYNADQAFRGGNRDSLPGPGGASPQRGASQGGTPPPRSNLLGDQAMPYRAAAAAAAAGEALDSLGAAAADLLSGAGAFLRKGTGILALVIAITQMEDCSGERIVFHYTTAAAAFNIQRIGLFSQSSATIIGTYTAQEALEFLGVKNAEVVVIIRDNKHFVPNRPPIVQPHPFGPGGGADLTNNALVPPKDIIGVIPVRR